VVFTSATNSALPLPVTSELTTRTHGTPLDARHLHPAFADTAIWKGPPCGTTRDDELPNSKWHGAGSCVTVTRLSLRTRAVDLSIAAGFSETSTLTDAGPWPEVGRTWIHDASLLIVQEHSRLVATLAVRREADDGTDVGRPVKSLRHFVAGSGPVIWLTLLSVHPQTISAAAMKKPRAMNACDRGPAGKNHISTNYQIDTNFQAQRTLDGSAQPAFRTQQIQRQR
jgi:hypothetical protein